MYLLRLFAAIIALSFVVPAFAETDPQTHIHQKRVEFARDFAQVVMMIIHDKKKSTMERQQVLRNAFGSSVDITWIAKFVLGRAWKEATEAQQEQYTSLYRKFLTDSYVANFAENPTRRINDIKVGMVDDRGDNTFTVSTRMKLMNQDDLKVDYLVSDTQGSYKVLDIVIENVSLITTHRAEFSALASKQGVTGVIHTLEARLNALKEITVSMK